MIDRSKTLSLGIAGALCACLLSNAVAETEGADDRRRQARDGNADAASLLERLDRNGDGIWTPEDVPEGDRAEGLLRRLERLDADGDGQVTLAELEAVAVRRRGSGTEGEARRGQDRGEGRSERFEALDADGDGRLSLAEFRGNGRALKRLDADGGGLVLRSDLGEGEGAERALKLFDRLDADQDGRLTSAEIEAFRVPRFERLDADADGFLSRAELQTRPKRRGEGSRP